MQMIVLPVCMSAYHMHDWCQGDQKRALDPRKLRLHRVESCHVGARDHTQPLWKSSQGLTPEPAPQPSWLLFCETHTVLGILGWPGTYWEAKVTLNSSSCSHSTPRPPTPGSFDRRGPPCLTLFWLLMCKILPKSLSD